MQVLDPIPTYQIKVEGRLGQEWLAWLDDMTLELEQAGDGPPISTLTGPIVDQAKLRGILSRIWDLNLTVLSVSRIDTRPEGERR